MFAKSHELTPESPALPSWNAFSVLSFQRKPCWYAAVVFRAAPRNSKPRSVFPQPNLSLRNLAITEISIPDLRVVPRFCDQFPCGAHYRLPTIAASFLFQFLGDLS